MRKTLYYLFVLLLIHCQAFSQNFFTDLYYNPTQITQTPSYFQYGKSGRHLAQLYVAHNQNPKPLIILVPGSGFSSEGDPVAASHEQAMLYARRGFAVMVIDYYRVPNPKSNLKAVIAEAATDVHAAIQYAVKNKGGLFNINTDFTFILGESAGGIASTAALWLNDVDFKNRYGIDKNKNTKYPTTTYNVKGLCLLSSGVESIDIFNNRSRHQNMPTLMLHGAGDQTVPFATGIAALPTMRGAGSIYSAMAADPTFKCGVLYAFSTYKHDLLSSLPTIYNPFEPRNRQTPYSWANSAIAVGFYSMMTGVCTKAVVIDPVTPTARTAEEENQEEFRELSEDKIFFSGDNLVVRLAVSAPYSCQIHDLQGNMVYSKADITEEEINVSELQSGLYMVSIQSENKNSRLKILKD